jgi:hypothetical protein
MKINVGSLRRIIFEEIQNDAVFLRKRADTALSKAKQYSALSYHQLAFDTFNRAKTYYARARQSFLSEKNDDMAAKMFDAQVYCEVRSSMHGSALKRES